MDAYNQPDTLTKILSVIKKNILDVVLLSVIVFFLLTGLTGDLIFCVLFGPAFSALFVPLSLFIALISLLLRRNIKALCSSAIIILCCALSIWVTTKILCMLSYFSYTETAELVFTLWIRVFFR